MTITTTGTPHVTSAFIAAMAAWLVAELQERKL